jgi:hypothetical protein
VGILNAIKMPWDAAGKQASKTPSASATSLSGIQASNKAKMEILTLGATLDRGQAYNPTSGEYYADRMEIAKQKIGEFVRNNPNNVPKDIEEIKGEWVG